MFKGSADAIQTLRQEKTAFFPVTGPNLTHVQCPETPISAAVAFVNGGKISLLNLDRFAAPSFTSATPVEGQVTARSAGLHTASHRGEHRQW
jgi:hypothetical protein